jgi:hypothetical protein
MIASNVDFLRMLGQEGKTLSAFGIREHHVFHEGTLAHAGAADQGHVIPAIRSLDAEGVMPVPEIRFSKNCHNFFMFQLP